MKKIFGLSRAAIAVALFASPAFCDWRKLPPTDFAVAPPPAPGSPADAQDMATLLQLQASRTAADCAQAASEKSPDFHTLWDSSGLLSQPELDAVSGIEGEATNLAWSVSGYYKKKYGRPRPYNEDARVQPCADKPGGATSYPSTHATSGALEACVLEMLFPDRAGTLAAYGKRVGDLRAIAGVHHPTDVAAGQDLAAQICAALKDDSGFQSELSQVRMSLPSP